MKKTKSELARRLKITRQALHKHLARPDAPAPDRQGRYNDAAVLAYVDTRRAMDNNVPSSKALLGAKIAKLTLECDQLRRRLKSDVPSVPVEDISALLWEAVNEQHRLLIAALNSAAAALAQESDPHKIIRALHHALAAAEFGFCAWCRENALKDGKVKVEWPIPHPALMCKGVAP